MSNLVSKNSYILIESDLSPKKLKNFINEIDKCFFNILIVSLFISFEKKSIMEEIAFGPKRSIFYNMLILF